MNMTAQELSELAGISLSHARYIISGQRTASRKLAETLEEKTGIRAEAWLFPDKYYNPIIKKAVNE
jgi:plasmid maintenance system antidote protein VapI